MLRLLLQFLLILLIVIILLGAGGVWYFNQELPNVDKLRNVKMQVPLRIYSADEKLIAEFGEKRRRPVPLQQIPLQLQHALIATEDQRFYEHSGVDFRGLARAAIEVISTGRKVQGGSTITMQVARNFFLNRKKTYIRKLKEILLALKIGRELSKDKVLELYLNKVYFGQRAYGVGAAARIYYGEQLGQLTLPQMAMIAGLPQAPSALNPINDPVAALDRRTHVLQRMLDQRYITPQQYQQAVKTPLTASYHHLDIGLKAPYVAEMVRDAMVKQYGAKAYTMGLSVYTTINSADQQAATKAIKSGLLGYDKRHGYRGAIANWGIPDTTQLAVLAKKLKQFPTIADLQVALVLSVQAQQAQILLSNGDVEIIPWSGLSWAHKQYQQGKWVGPPPQTASDVVKPGDLIHVVQNVQSIWQLTQLPEVEAALVSLNPQNGALLAVVGGFNFRKSKFNRVTSAERQSGSGFKPFIYSAAFAKGLTLATLVNDAPIVMPDQSATKLWRPQNDNLTFNGPTRLRVGLMRSRNLVSIRLLQEIGIPYTVNYDKKFAFKPSALPQTLSLALGSGVVTPLELARGLATFANGGFLIKPYFISKILNEDGAVIFKADAAQACYLCSENMKDNTDTNIASHIITPQNAYLLNSAMKSVITSGTGRAALTLKRPDLAGKTGTTNDQNDAWFSGFNTKVLTVAWLGFDQPRSTFEYGSRAALPIWINYMRQALKDIPESNLSRPPSIVTVRINAKTGQATSAMDKDAIFEIFREKYAPTLNQSVTPASSVATADDSTVQSVQNENQPLF